jgi:hypothetical protein
MNLPLCQIFSVFATLMLFSTPYKNDLRATATKIIAHAIPAHRQAMRVCKQRAHPNWLARRTQTLPGKG